MSRSHQPLSPDVRALLDQERVIPSLPPSVCARALARANAAVVAGPPTFPDGLRAAPRVGWGVAVATVCIVGAAVVVTHEIDAHRRPPVASAHPSEPITKVVAPTPAPSTAAPTPAVVPPSLPAPASRPTRSSQADPGLDELHLLRQARVAVARQDFSAALRPIAEHARRFEHGRLTEEREALRIRALSGLGRIVEARRAVDAFEARFPRSVLLPAVRQMPVAAP